MKRVLSIVLCLFAVFCGEEAGAKALSQKDSLATVYGVVLDSLDNRGLRGANVLLYTVGRGQKIDSTFTTTDINGQFRFHKIVPQRVSLKVFMVGMNTTGGSYDLVAGKNVIYMKMSSGKNVLQSSKIAAEIPLSKKVGDTVIFNAAAVQTMPDEQARAILGQLPGFRITDNDIYVDGEKVSRTYVNGTLVFGDNTLTALDVLNADEVSQVRVYDEQSAVDRRRGEHHSRKDKVIDIVTKEKVMTLAEAGVGASGGIDDTRQLRYSAVAAGAFYSEMMQVSAAADADNYLRESNKYASSSGIRNLSVRNRFDRHVPTALDGYSEKLGADFTLVKYWKDRNYGNSFSAQYGYSHIYRRNISQAITNYYGNGDIPVMEKYDTSSSKSTIGMHKVELDFNLLDTPLKTLRFGVSASFSDNGSNALNINRTVSNGVETQQMKENTGADGKTNSVSAYLGWTNNDAVKVRPYWMIDMSYGNSDNLSWTVDTLHTSFNRRQLSSDGYSRNLNLTSRLSIDTYLANDELHTLSISSGLNTYFVNKRSRQLTLDMLDGGEREDLANTYDYRWKQFGNALYSTLNYNRGELNLRIGIEGRNDLLFDDESYPYSYSKTKTYWSLFPNFDFKYKNLQIGLACSSDTPSTEQIRDRITDTNPMVLLGGNPNLKQSHNVEMTALWTIPMGENGTRLLLNLRQNAVFKSIVSQIRYFDEDTALSEWDGYVAKAGSMLQTYVNADRPSFTTSLSANFNGLFCHRKLTFNSHLGGEILYSPEYTLNERQTVTTSITQGVLDFGYRPNKKLRLSLSPMVTYNRSSGTEDGVLSESILYRITFSSVVRFLKKGYWNVNYSHTSNNYLSGIGIDHSIDRLSSSVGWEFMKNTLDVSVQCCDLLNSGSLYNTAITASYMRQTWTPTYGRFYLLSAKYYFRRSK